MESFAKMQKLNNLVVFQRLLDLGNRKAKDRTNVNMDEQKMRVKAKATEIKRKKYIGRKRQRKK